MKINRSYEGPIIWTHNRRLVHADRDSHYTFLDTQRSTGTELEISNATAEYGGSYEVLLLTPNCGFRDVITVKVQGKCHQKITSQC